jgi:hypothetical protein
MADYSKKVKRLLRELMTEAYERELHRELTKLDRSFSEWRSGSISSGELSHRLHQYETGPSRELYKRYTDTSADMAVAYAIMTGILKRDELPVELLAVLERPLSFYQALQERHELREPDDL